MISNYFELAIFLFYWYVVRPILNLRCRVFGHGPWQTDEMSEDHGPFCPRCFQEQREIEKIKG